MNALQPSDYDCVRSISKTTICNFINMYLIGKSATLSFYYDIVISWAVAVLSPFTLVDVDSKHIMWFMSIISHLIFTFFIYWYPYLKHEMGDDWWVQTIYNKKCVKINAPFLIPRLVFLECSLNLCQEPCSSINTSYYFWRKYSRLKSPPLHCCKF